MNSVKNKNILVMVVLVGALSLTLIVAKNQQSVRQFAQSNNESNSKTNNLEHESLNPPNVTVAPPRNNAYAAPDDITSPNVIVKGPASGTRVKANSPITL